MERLHNRDIKIREYEIRSTQREKFQKWLDIAPSNILTVTNCFLVDY